MKAIKLPDDIYETIRKEAERRNWSMAQFVQHLIELWRTGGSEEKPIKKIIEKEDFPIMYPTRCRKCGRLLKPGDRVYYVKYVYEDGTSQTYILCQDCYLEGRMKTLAKTYRKKRELEFIIKQLRREADLLSAKVSKLERLYNLAQDLESLAARARELYSSFTKEVMDAIKDEKLSEAIMKGLEDLQELLNRLAAAEKQLAELSAFTTGNLEKKQKVVKKVSE